MDRQAIITIFGRAGAGKDTLGALIALALQKQTGRVAVVTKFAAPLKEAARRLFGDDFDLREVKEVPREVCAGHVRHHALNAVAEAGVEPSRDVMALVNLAFDLTGVHDAESIDLSPRQFQRILGTEVGRALNENLWTRRIYGQTWGRPLVLTDARFESELSERAFKVFVYRPETPDVAPHVSEALALYLEDCYRELGRGGEYPYVSKLLTQYGEFAVANNTRDMAYLAEEARLIVSEYRAWLSSK